MASADPKLLPPKSAEAIRAELVQSREQIAQSIEGLRVETRKLLDWREWIARRPGFLIAGAFVAGYVVAKRGSPRFASAIVGLATMGEVTRWLMDQPPTEKPVRAAKR